jgi:cathepsin D
MKLLILLYAVLIKGFQELMNYDSIISVPLKKLQFNSYEKQAQVSFLMNSQSTIISSNFLESTNAKLRLKNFSNSQYVGRVGVGSPPQYLDVIFDTGSANFWVNSKLCHDLACESHSAYDNSLSSSYEKLGYVINVEFGTGGIRGEINYETVTVAGISIPRQSFGEITDEIGEVFVQGKFSGILGLAFPKMAAFNFDPVFDNMINEHHLEKNLFTFYYSSDENSEVSFGGIDYSKFAGEIMWNDVIEEFYWVIEINDIRLGKESLGLCDDGCKAAVDTGTSFLTAPPKHLNKLLDSIYLDCQNLESVESLVFVIGEDEYEILPEMLVIQGDKDCTVGIMPLDVPKP